ncbi:rRNA maturation RNase YbeY [Paenibacillus flagellatus]|uniref:Endoribonuclease YbeY n=1 Tax=Paenibacillus flagellatus TaxID=2211139 RepID=A0A2V5KS30_9BACL|nr:rRNA maturation RNase YbeY [Paenibacillus flagellatus]PYI51756.1 rRNA maturation RNase YbeY [Paenibacillus flagellatus]
MTVRLVWNDEQNALEIGEPLVARLNELLKLAAEAEGVESGEVALSFVDDEAIRALNRDYRNLDKPTDVLSFSMVESVEDEPGILYGGDDGDDEYERIGGEADEADDGNDDDDTFVEPLGDIVISTERAIAQAEEYGHSVEREIGFLFVHGFLHLIGYDHADAESERIMFGKQEAVLQKAGLTR